MRARREINVRCRVGVSQRFSVRDRLRFLWSGRMYVSTVNGKEHTTVLLSIKQPSEQAQRTQSE